MEDGLGGFSGEDGEVFTVTGLNPCFSGGWSRRNSKTSQKKSVCTVLILVLVEDGLGAIYVDN